MLIIAFDIKNGDFLWRTTFDISDLYTLYDLKPAFYNGNLLVPLDTKIEYINTDNGMMYGEYVNDDIEQIISFNENSIQKDIMVFIIEDIDVEYVMVDLEGNIKPSMGVLDAEMPKLGQWISNMFFDVSSYGTVMAYELQPGVDMKINAAWQENYNSPLSLAGSDKKYIYLLDIENNIIIVVDIQSGNTIKSLPLLWPVKKIKMNNNIIIVQSSSKLYLISI